MAHELARSDERYRLVARATRDVVYDWHVASGRIEWTESMQSVFGYAPEQIGDGAWWLERVHPADRDALQRSSPRRWPIPRLPSRRFSTARDVPTTATPTYPGA